MNYNYFYLINFILSKKIKNLIFVCNCKHYIQFTNVKTKKKNNTITLQVQYRMALLSLRRQMTAIHSVLPLLALEAVEKVSISFSPGEYSIYGDQSFLSINMIKKFHQKSAKLHHLALVLGKMRAQSSEWKKFVSMKSN